MAPEWESRSVYSLGSYQNGRPFKPDETRASGGMPIIKIGELNRGITSSTGRFDGQFDDKFAIARGDLIFAWSGTIVVKRWDGADGVLNQHLFKVVAAPDVDQRFLGYLLMSLVPTFNRLVDDQRTTMGHVKVSDLKHLMVSVPSLAEQRRIAEALMSLEDRGEANRRVLGTIEAFAKTVLRTLAAGSELRPMTIDTVATLIRGASYGSDDLRDSTNALVSLKAFHRNGGYQRSGLKGFAGTYKPSQAVAPRDTVVAQTDITQDADVVGRAIRVPKDGSYENLVASMDLGIVRPKDGLITPEVLFLVLSSEEFREHCRARANGTTVLHLGNDAVKSFAFGLPDEDTVARATALTRSLWAHADALATESETVLQIFRVLLPEMVAGRMEPSAALAPQVIA